jgi:hypothetical protein
VIGNAIGKFKRTTILFRQFRRLQQDLCKSCKACWNGATLRNAAESCHAIATVCKKRGLERREGAWTAAALWRWCLALRQLKKILAKPEGSLL